MAAPEDSHSESEFAEFSLPDAEREVWEDATPVCTRCLTPVDPLQHYCHVCFNAVGQLTPYIPFVNIPYNYSFYDIIWTRLWYPVHESPRRRYVYALTILWASVALGWVWILLLGVPLWWWKRKHPTPPRRCSTCGYDLRSTVNRCPECGAAIEDTPVVQSNDLPPP